MNSTQPLHNSINFFYDRLNIVLLPLRNKGLKLKVFFFLFIAILFLIKIVSFYFLMHFDINICEQKLFCLMKHEEKKIISLMLKTPGH